MEKSLEFAEVLYMEKKTSQGSVNRGYKVLVSWWISITPKGLLIFQVTTWRVRDLINEDLCVSALFFAKCRQLLKD